MTLTVKQKEDVFSAALLLVIFGILIAMAVGSMIVFVKVTGC